MTKYWRYSILAVLVLASFAVSTNAQQSNQQQPNGTPAGVPNRNARGIGIAVIYTDSFYDPKNGISRLVNSIKSLDEEFLPRKTELHNLQQRIEQLTNETSATAPGVTSTTAQTKLSQLEQLKKDVQRKTEDAQAEYGKRLGQALNPIFEDLDKAIKSFAQQRGIALVLDGSKMEEAILYLSESLDMTRAFVVEFNRTNPSASVASPR